MGDSGATGDGWARRTFASLRRPVFRRFFLGHIVSLTGFWLRIAAQGWLVYEATGSESDLGLVAALGLLPFVVLAPLGGALADRHDRRALLARGQAATAALNLALGLAVILGRVVLWEIALAAVLLGCARAIEIPVRQALIEDLVGPEDRSNAIALNAAGFQLAQVVGPALAGALIGLVGIGPCFLIVALLATVNVFVVPSLDVPERERPAARYGAWRGMREGFAFVRGHRRIRTLLLLVALAFLFLFPYRSLLPAVAGDVLGWGSLGYGVLLGAIGLGALFGALWVAGRAALAAPTRSTVFGLVWLGCLLVAGLGVAAHPALVLPGLLAAGFCQVAFVASANALVQSSAPEAFRGRVMGVWTFVFGASFPLGSALMGFAAERWGLAVAFSGGALLTLLATTLVRLRLPPRASASAPPPDTSPPDATAPTG
jgi:MFS family permease